MVTPKQVKRLTNMTIIRALGSGGVVLRNMEVKPFGIHKKTFQPLEPALGTSSSYYNKQTVIFKFTVVILILNSSILTVL